MKPLTKRILALLLAFACAVCLAACSRVKEPTLLNEKVVEMIDFDVARDAEGGYAMLYPGVTDEDTYRASASYIYGYFPVTAGYTWKLGQWNYTKALGSGAEVYEGVYEITFDERVYLIYAIWQSDAEGSGFKKFQIVSQEDYLAAQNQQG